MTPVDAATYETDLLDLYLQGPGSVANPANRHNENKNHRPQDNPAKPKAPVQGKVKMKILGLRWLDDKEERKLEAEAQAREEEERSKRLEIGRRNVEMWEQWEVGHDAKEHSKMQEYFKSTTGKRFRPAVPLFSEHAFLPTGATSSTTSGPLVAVPKPSLSAKDHRKPEPFANAPTAVPRPQLSAASTSPSPDPVDAARLVIIYKLCRQNAKSGLKLSHCSGIIKSIIANGESLFKVGITEDPRRRDYSREVNGYALDRTIIWKTMLVVHQTTIESRCEAPMLEAALIALFQHLPCCMNRSIGGDGWTEARGLPMYVYVVSTHSPGFFFFFDTLTH